MNNRSTLALVVIAVLAACSKANDPTIQLVKGQPSEANGLTVGQVLDAKSNCTTKEWISEKDKYQRDVVTFRCKVDLPQDQITSAVESSTGAVRRQLTWIATTSCKGADPQPLVAKHEELTKAYYAKFKSVTEVLEFVVNQGQVVEVHTGLTDVTGADVPLRDWAVHALPGYVEKPDGGPAELSALVTAVRDGWHEADLSCDQMRSALGIQPPPAAAQDSPVASQPDSTSQGTASQGDQEPPPADTK